MSKYKKVTVEKGELFLKLYKKHLLLKVGEMEDILKTLPTDVIERCFDGVEFFDKDFDVSKLDNSTFGFGGLCGYEKVENVAHSLIYLDQYNKQGGLDEFLSIYGHKVNRKNIGVEGNVKELSEYKETDEFD